MALCAYAVVMTRTVSSQNTYTNINYVSSLPLSLSLLVYTTSQFKQFFVGDLLYLRCNISSDTAVKWYRNNTELQQKTNKTLKIAVATPKDSGSYQCESNGEKSDDFKINVLSKYTTQTI